MESCPDSYHLCSFDELYSGAYQTARKNGWFKFSSEVWARETQADIDNIQNKDELGNPDVIKMALCCSNK
jgi:hypothetical protein